MVQHNDLHEGEEAHLYTLLCSFRKRGGWVCSFQVNRLVWCGTILERKLIRSRIMSWRGVWRETSGVGLLVGCLYGSHWTPRGLWWALRERGTKEALPVWPVVMWDTKRADRVTPPSEFKCVFAVLCVVKGQCSVPSSFYFKSDISGLMLRKTRMLKKNNCNFEKRHYLFTWLISFRTQCTI